MLWYDKSIGQFKSSVTQEIVERSLTKKVTRSDVGGGAAAKKNDTTYSKQRDFESDVLFEWPR